MSTAAIHLERLLEPLAGCLSPDVAAKAERKNNFDNVIVSV